MPGRKTKYLPEYAPIAENICLLKNCKDTDLAKILEISERTLNYWKKKHPEFLQALERGKEGADIKVARSVYEAAVGYEHPEDKIFLGPKGKPVIVKTTKHYPPDIGAAKMWLGNRQPEKWKDRQELAINGKVKFDGEGRIFTDLEMAARLSYLIELAVRRKREHDGLEAKETKELPEKLNE
jgi:hypothetical protein